MGRIVAWLSTVAPTLVLAFWAGGYLLECLKSVAQPGKPLDVYLPTRGGSVRLTAASWGFDLAHRRLTASHVALFSPAGDRIAAVDQVVATAPSQGQGGYAVWLSGLTAGLDRLHDGTWRHANLLPEPSKETGTASATTSAVR